MIMKGGDKMNKKLLGLSALTLAGVMMLSGATSADAFGDGEGQRGMRSVGEGQGFGLVSEEMREQFRSEYEALSDEEKESLRAEREVNREQKRAEMEEFTGMTREEMREAHRNGQDVSEILSENGVTEESAKAYLTQKANERVDTIVERHDLDEAEVQSIKDRISGFVQSKLDRWFGN